MDILKISVLGAAGVLLGILLKDRAPEYVSLVTMGIGLVILGLVVGKISYLFQSLERLKQSLPIDGSYITTLLKMIGAKHPGYKVFHINLPHLPDNLKQNIVFSAHF